MLGSAYAQESVKALFVECAIHYISNTACLSWGEHQSASWQELAQRAKSLLGLRGRLQQIETMNAERKKICIVLRDINTFKTQVTNTERSSQSQRGRYKSSSSLRFSSLERTTLSISEIIAAFESWDFDLGERTSSHWTLFPIVYGQRTQYVKIPSNSNLYKFRKDQKQKQTGLEYNKLPKVLSWISEHRIVSQSKRQYPRTTRWKAIKL